jgi:GNAT superfamily N-acetyltransferase
MEKIEVVKWQEGINLQSFSRQEIFDSIQEIDKSVFHDDALATQQSDIERYEAYKDSYIFALSNGKIIGYLCYFPITEKFYESVIEGIKVYDGDIANTDICNLRDDFNYIFLLSAAIKPEFQKKDISKQFSEILVKEFAKIKIRDMVSYAFTASGEHFLNHIGLKSYNEMEDGIKLMRVSLQKKNDNFDLIFAIPCGSTNEKRFKPTANSFLEEFSEDSLTYKGTKLKIKNAVYDNKFFLPKNADIFCEQMGEHSKYELISSDESSMIKIERNPLAFGQVILYKDELYEDDLNEEYIPLCCYNFFIVLSKLSIIKSSAKNESSINNHNFNIIYFVVPDINYHDLTLLMDQSHNLWCNFKGNIDSQTDFTDYLDDTFGYKYFGKIYNIIFSDENQFKAIINDDKLKLFNILASEEYKSKESYVHQIELSENTEEYIYSEADQETSKIFTLTKKAKFYDDYNMYNSYSAYASIYSYYYVIKEKGKYSFYERISPDKNNENFSSEANILFILENELFKITACLVSSMEIYKQINDPDMKDIRNMFKRFINTRPLFEKLNYRYLGAQKEADFIYKQFRINDIFDDYDRKRELLKSYCEVHTSIKLNRNSKILNWIGVIFALIAIWDTLELFSRVLFDEHKIILNKNELIIPGVVGLLIVVVGIILNIQPVKYINKFINLIKKLFSDIKNSLNKFMGTDSDIIKLNKEQFKDLQNLFSECFGNDPYYSKVFSNKSMREELKGPAFSSIFLFLLRKDGAYGVYNNKKLIAFLLLFDYHKTKNYYKEQFETIFRKYSYEKEIPYKKEIHEKIDSYGDNVIYLLSIGVSKNYRRRDIARKLINFAIKNYKNYYVVSDVSNASSLNIYKKCNFECEEIDGNYFFVIRKPS